jgi:hypothetical protein
LHHGDYFNTGPVAVEIADDALQPSLMMALLIALRFAARRSVWNRVTL